MEWMKENDRLYKKFGFKDFAACFAFMTQVAAVAEAQQHHPTWTNTYNTLEIWLTTHDAGNTITAKDEALAQAIDHLYAQQ